MAASAADIARLRRMAGELDDSNGYTAPVLTEIIERYPLLDADGLDATDTDWVAGYDLNAAASEVWQEKAGALAAKFDFDSDGASFKRSQMHAQAAKQARFYAARRAPGSVTLVRDTTDDVEVGTL